MRSSPVPACTAYSVNYEGWTLARGGRRGNTRNVNIYLVQPGRYQEQEAGPYIYAQKGRRRVLRTPQGPLESPQRVPVERRRSLFAIEAYIIADNH